MLSPSYLKANAQKIKEMYLLGGRELTNITNVQYIESDDSNDYLRVLIGARLPQIVPIDSILSVGGSL